jgi:ribosomal protein S18
VIRITRRKKALCQEGKNHKVEFQDNSMLKDEIEEKIKHLESTQ